MSNRTFLCDTLNNKNGTSTTLRKNVSEKILKSAAATKHKLPKRNCSHL